MRNWKFVGLGLLAAVVLWIAYYFILPFMIAFLTVSVIGIPLAIVLYCVPAAIFWSAAFFIPWHLMGGTRRAAAIGLAVLATVAVVPPTLANLVLEARTWALMSGDHDSPLPLEGKTIAIRANGIRSDKIPCRHACLQLLALGRVERILFEREAHPKQWPSGNDWMPSFRLEHRAQCPQANVDESIGKELANEIPAGFCLIQEEAQFTIAEFVISEEFVTNGKSAAEAGLSLFTDTRSAVRTVVMRNTGQRFAEIIRKTDVTASLLWPVLAPGFDQSGASFAPVPAFMRRDVRRNPQTRCRRYSSAEFLEAKLGLERTHCLNGEG